MSGSPQLTTDAEAIGMLARLDDVCDELASHEDRVEAFAGLRNDLFMRLLAMGVTQREVASRAKISEPAVAKAVKKAQRLTAEHEAGEHPGGADGCPHCPGVQAQMGAHAEG